MIKTIKYKKILSLILLVITLLSVAQPIFAVSGNNDFVGGQYASGMKTTDHKPGETGILIRRLINYDTGERYTVFCAEHKVEFDTGTIYNGNYYTPTDATIRKACKVAYFGWYSKYGDYVVDGGILAGDMIYVKKDYVYTQQYIWEVLGQTNSTFIDSSYQREYENFKQDIENKISNMATRPSFDGTTINVQAGESKTINDTNGVLASYPSIDRTTNGIRVTHSQGSNSMTILVDENTSLENYTITDAEFKSWGMIKDGTEDKDTMVFFEFAEGVQNQLYSMSYNDPVTLGISLKIESFGKLELSKLNEEGDLISGAVFNVSGPNGYNKDVTVTNGKITLEKLKKGTYTIKEISAPYGYLLDTKTYNVEVKVNQTATQAVVNIEPTGTFTLVKKNADESANLKGAEYRIWNSDYDKTVTTNDEGEIKVEGLKLGKYNYQETKAPEGYLIDNTIYSFELKYKDQNTSVIYANATRTNEEPTGKITIIKRDSETGSTPQGDATFVDAKYEVYANEDIWNKAHTKQYYKKSDLVVTRTMNNEGKTEDVENLPIGKYLVKETVSSEGYLIDTKEYDVNLEYKNQNTPIISDTVTSNEVVKKMPIHIFKSGIDEQSGEVQGLEGAEFTIKLASDVEEAYNQGYTYPEIWNGVDEYGNKVDVDAKRVAKAQAIAPTYDTLTTDSEGNAYSDIKFPYGKYIGKETKTPKDFETASDFTFSITKDESEIQDVAQKVKDIFINNEQLEAYIKLVKKDLDTDKIVTLNNATFQIKAAEDIYDRGNGKILYKKGEVIKQKIGSTVYDSFTTNAENLVVPDNSYSNDNDELGTVVTPLKLDVGKYEITEILIPQGFLQLEKPIQFTIEGIRDYDKDSQDDYIKTVEIKNDQPTGTILLDKSLAIKENVDTSLVDISDLSGIKFKLTAKEDIISPIDGSIIYNAGQEVGTYNLTKEGKLEINELPMGVYEIQEIETLDGLVLNYTKYEIRFTQKDTVTKVYEQGLEVKNDTTLIEISKTDITGEKELEGAKLSVLDEQGNIIDQWTSTSKVHTIEGLTTGKEYTLREDLAPLGFVKSTDIKFTVENTTEAQKVTMVDKVVTMTKEDIGGTEIEGAEMSVTNENGEVVDSWISTKEPHKINGLEEGKTYTLHENYAPDGFVIATDVEFTVTTDKETQEIKMTDKIVEVEKVDINGNAIEGVTLILTNTKTKNIVDKWITTKEPHKVSGLIEGETYVLHEEETIGDYVKAQDIEFTVTEDKETQIITMVDKIVEVTKTDFVTGEEIEGAELKVVDENGNTVDSWTSTKTPHKVKGLEEGKTYKLIETLAPYGYELTNEIEFIVTSDKEVQKIEMKDMPILQTVQLVKKDSNTNEVIKDKFTFGLYEDQECTKLIKTVESDKDLGTVTFSDLRYGTYFIKEESSPKGYVLSDKVIKLEINDEGIFIDGEKIEKVNDKYTFEFYNTPVDTPKTGDNSNLALWASLLGIATITLVGMGVHECKKRKINKE